MFDEYLFRDKLDSPVPITGSEGSYLKAGPIKFLDFIMGWCVGNAGWNKKEINRAVREFKGPNYVIPRATYLPWDALAKRLAKLTPGKLQKSFRATGGTEAVELAMKISRAFNRREKFMAFDGAYHGQSFSCLSLVGTHEEKFGPYPPTIRLTVDDWEATTEKAVKEIKTETISAFISEPIICNLGVVLPPQSFFDAVQEACKETNTVFIMDEVATGFGRTGKWFATEHYNLSPDVMTVAKGFSSGYAGIGAAIATPEVAETMRFEFSNYSTFGWLPVSVEATLANINYIEKNNLVQRSAESGDYLMKQLSEFCEPSGKGLCIGFGVKNKQIWDKCLGDRLITSVMDSRMVLYPALDVTKEQMDHAVGIIKKHY
ncbi:aspartate aminotransferase family protein [archaeon]